MLRPAIALILAAGALPAGEIAVSETPSGYRYETPRAIVELDRGRIGEAERLELVLLVDRGIRDLSALLEEGSGAGSPRGRKLFYRVSRRVGISSTYGLRVALPYDRVANRNAPYLHETAHALLDGGGDDPPLWLSEGLASYLESHIAEKHGGYQGNVFSSGGNRGIDSAARGHLSTVFGRDAFDAVGSSRIPSDIRSDRENVARPFYVLSQSFVKFLVERAGLDEVLRMYRTGSDKIRERSVLEWKADWRALLDGRPGRRGAG